jgi:regulator of replication initiation timing
MSSNTENQIIELNKKIESLQKQLNIIISENQIKQIEMTQLMDRICLLEERIYNNFNA